MSKKLFSILALLLVAMMVLTACQPQATAEPTAVAEEPTAVAEEPTAAPVMEEDPWGYITYKPGTKIKIAVSSALAGGYAVYGQDMLNGVDLAISTFGQLQGWDIISEGGDDGCEGAPGVTVAEKFSADPDVIGVVGPMCSGTVVPASEIYAKANVVMITPSSTAVIVTARGFENLFRIVANDELQAQVTVEYLSQELSLKSVGIIHDQSVYGEGLAAAVKEKFEAAGGTVTGFEGITRGEVDYSAVIQSIVAGSPEAVYFGGMDAEGALIIKQLSDAGYEGVFFGPDGIKSKPTFVDGSGGTAEGSYMTFGAVGGATGYEDFLAQFTEKFGGEPVAYGPGSYDAAMIMLQAANAVAFVDAEGNLKIGRKALADMVRSTPYDGITGHLEFTETGDLAVVSITVFQVQSGEIVEVKSYDFGN